MNRSKLVRDEQSFKREMHGTNLANEKATQSTGRSESLVEATGKIFQNPPKRKLNIHENQERERARGRRRSQRHERRRQEGSTAK